MPSILADADSRGQLQAILSFFQRTAWGSLWDSLGVTERSFAALGLTAKDSDRAVWRAAQRHDAILVTANRNQDDEESLETVLRAENQPHSLPVVTYGDAQRILQDSVYRERAALRLLEIIMDLDRYRGAGRVYIP
ncbi:MAG: ACP S-malonyltransferase [Planctomycetota bacterium]|nr:ACP S-malonyltransferase [Planctomycetota bacterium]